MLYENVSQMDAWSRKVHVRQTYTSLVVAAGGLSLKPIKRATVGTQRVAGRVDREINPRMCAPIDVPGHGAMQRQVRVVDFYHTLGIVLRFAHFSSLYRRKPTLMRR